MHLCPSGSSSLGRARPCQGRGSGFEARLPLSLRLASARLWSSGRRRYLNVARRMRRALRSASIERDGPPSYRRSVMLRGMTCAPIACTLTSCWRKSSSLARALSVTSRVGPGDGVSTVSGFTPPPNGETTNGSVWTPTATADQRMFFLFHPLRGVKTVSRRLIISPRT